MPGPRVVALSTGPGPDRTYKRALSRLLARLCSRSCVHRSARLARGPSEHDIYAIDRGNAAGRGSFAGFNVGETRQEAVGGISRDHVRRPWGIARIKRLKKCVCQTIFNRHSLPLSILLAEQSQTRIDRAQTRVGRPHSRTWAGSRSSWSTSTLVSKVGPRTVFRSARQGAATRRGSSATAAPLVGRARAPPARARNQVLGSPEARERRRIVRTSRACPRHDFPGRRCDLPSSCAGPISRRAAPSATRESALLRRPGRRGRLRPRRSPPKPRVPKLLNAASARRVHEAG